MSLKEIDPVILTKQLKFNEWARETARQKGAREVRLEVLSKTGHLWSLAAFSDKATAKIFEDAIKENGFQTQLVTWDISLRSPYVKFRCGTNVVGPELAKL